MFVDRRPQTHSVVLSLVSAFLAFSTLASTPAFARVSWQKLDLSQAIERARVQKKQVLVDVWATWCGPCQDMEAQVFSRPDVTRAMKPLVTVRVDADTPAGKAAIERYHVVGFPTFLLLDGEGREVDRLMGFVEPEKFIEVLAGYRQGKGTLAELEARFAAAGGDAELAAAIAQRSAIRGELARAEALLSLVLAADPKNERKLAAATLFEVAYSGHLRLGGDPKKAEVLLAALSSEFPDAPETKRIPMALAKAARQAGDLARTRSLLDSVIAQSPGTSKVYNQVAWFCFREGYDLPFGIATARRGLEVDAQDAGLWDTLAEVLFKSGDRAGARAAIAKAVALDAKDPYFRSQTKKFSQR